MGHGKDLASLRRGWAIGFLRAGILGIIMFTRVTSEDQNGVPATGLLCISNCATCPVICAPPPPPVASHSPPSPPVHYSPPPPHSVHHSSPPPPPPPPSKSYHSPATPPPPINYPYIPPSQPSPTVGSRNYSYPYYYFYSSKAAPISIPASFLSFLSTTLLLSCSVIFW